MTAALRSLSQRLLDAAPVLLAVAVLLVYAPTLGFSLTNWDDDVAITNNVYLRAFTTDNLRHILTPGGIGHEVLYLPLLYLTHLVEIGLLGLRPWLLHLDNVLLHLLCVLLVWTLLRQLGASAGAALLGGLVFALHPLQVEAVAWVTGRKDVLSTVLAVAALLAWDDYLARTGPVSASTNRRGRAWPWYAGSLLLFAAALLAKPSVATLPAMMVLLAWWRRKRLVWRDLWATVPALLLSVVVYGITHSLGHPPSGAAPALRWRILSVPWVVWGWWNRLLLLHWPQPWYAWPDARLLPALLGAAVLVLVVLGWAAWFAWQGRRGWLALGVGWWLLAFLPAALIVVDFRDFITADRYGYFPMVALAWLLACAWDRVPPAWQRPARSLAAVALIWMAFVAALQVGVWRDSISLWTEVLRTYPEHATAHNSLGKALSERGLPGDRAEALRHFERAVASDPLHWIAWNNLGEELTEEGRTVDAVPALRHALTLNPGYFEAHYNLGLAFLQLAQDQAQQQEAARAAGEEFVAALNLRPASADAAYNLGYALTLLGRWTDAARAFEATLRLRPKDAQAQHALTDARAHARDAVAPTSTAP